MTTTVLRNAADSFTLERASTTNYNTSNILYTRSLAGQSARSFLYYTRPFPLTVTIISAKLRLVQKYALSGTVTNVARPIAAGWSTSRIAWANQPGVTGGTVTVTKSSPAAGTVWEFDVTAAMQTVANGGAWYGFCILGTTSPLTTFHSSQAATVSVRPVLEITWSDVPKTPTQLFPSNGRAVATAKPTVACNFVDISGDTTMAGIQVQINSTDTWATPSFDSGTVATSVPELDLSTTAFAGVAAGATVFWRVRVQDGAGLWSNWSASTSFQYQTYGTITLNNPAVAPNNYVSEATPPITWTFTGRTQKAFAVTIYDNSTGVPKFKWTSGKITSTSTAYTIPAGVIAQSTVNYTLLLEIWDTLDRESVAGYPVAARVARDFTLVWSASTTVVSGLTSSQPNSLFPWIQLDWTRGTQPDTWNIYRNGKLISVMQGFEPFVSGTSYRFTDMTAPPRFADVYTVVPVVNGLGSSSNPTTTITPKVISTLLTDKDAAYPILILNASRDISMDEDATIFEPTGNSRPVAIFGSNNVGMRGSVSGILSGQVMGITPLAISQRFEALARMKGELMWLTLVDRTIEVFIVNPKLSPRAKNEEVIYDVSFDFYQTDAV